MDIIRPFLLNKCFFTWEETSWAQRVEYNYVQESIYRKYTFKTYNRISKTCFFGWWVIHGEWYIQLETSIYNICCEKCNKNPNNI